MKSLSENITNMKKILTVLLLTISFFLLGWFGKEYFQKSYRSNLNEIPENLSAIQNPLNKYSIENLVKTEINPGTLQIGAILEKNDNFTSFLFHFSHNPSLNPKDVKITTGQINMPADKNTADQYPIIIMLRGYVDQKNYKTGDGTRNAGKYFSDNGFITIAPDFLGYAGSDPEAENIFEARFQTYVTVLSLLKTIEAKQISRNLISGPPQLTDRLINYSTILLWGHSNGGQIALTILEVTGKPYPTVLWAPVTKPFPYSILYYTDESDDHGKLIRYELADFEKSYNVEKFSLTNYLSLLNTEIQLHQGFKDNAVPKNWSDEFVSKSEKLGKLVKYLTYPQADHNMQPNWNSVVQKDLEFFQNHIK